MSVTLFYYSNLAQGKTLAIACANILCLQHIKNRLLSKVYEVH